MARAKRKAEATTESQEGHVDEDAVANDEGDVFGQAIAEARLDIPMAVPIEHEGNGHHGSGHHERPAADVQAASGNGHDVAHDGQEQPRRRSSEMITDVAARMTLFSNHATYRVAIVFDDGKPSEQVRDVLKAGFRWSNDDRAWEKATGYDARTATTSKPSGRSTPWPRSAAIEMGVTAER